MGPGAQSFRLVPVGSGFLNRFDYNMLKPLEFTLSVEDFLTFLLPEESATVGTEKFKMAVVNF